VSGSCTNSVANGSEPTYSDGSYTARVPSTLPTPNPIGVQFLNGSGSPFATAVINPAVSGTLYVDGSETSSSPFGTSGTGGGALFNRLTFTADITFNPPIVNFYGVNCPSSVKVAITLPTTIGSEPASWWAGVGPINGTGSFTFAGCSGSGTAYPGTVVVTANGYDPGTLIFDFTEASSTAPIPFTLVNGAWQIPSTATTFTGTAGYENSIATVTLH
jgi:hypothetical protein